MNNLNSLGFTHNGRKYYIFYDIFLHYNNNKITAVSPYYGEEIQLEKFYDIHNIKIIIDDHNNYRKIYTIWYKRMGALYFV